MFCFLLKLTLLLDESVDVLEHDVDRVPDLVGRRPDVLLVRPEALAKVGQLVGVDEPDARLASHPVVSSSGSFPYSEQTLEQALFLCTLFLSKIENVHLFLELTPTIRQMPQEVTNISED